VPHSAEHQQDDVTQCLPVLPIKNSVLFPQLVMPLAVGRPRSVAAINAAMTSEEKQLVVIAQRDPSVEDPRSADLYTIGTLAVVKKMAELDGAIQLLVQGIERVAILEFEKTEPFLEARVKVSPFPTEENAEVEALQGAVLDLVGRIIELSQPDARQHISEFLSHMDDPSLRPYWLASILAIDVAKEQAILDAPTQDAALRLLHDELTHEVQVMELRHKITSEARKEMGDQQRKYFLRQQLRAIQEELGEQSPEEADLESFRKKLEEADLPDNVRAEAEREQNRLGQMSAASPDYQLTRTYVEVIIELPWRRSTEDIIDLPATRVVLDEDHHDLEDVKDRIIEYLAVMKLNPAAHAPILCFVGPPGVGKTSVGQSIARAIRREFQRMSLGGLHDEAELRGHRRTYIGAMPGRILQAIRRARVNNPVLMLDEVDKLGRDYRGDPAAALLEILDPAQNFSFHDNYLDLPFDLSRVFFITTANTLDSVPRPLLDRMEVLRLPGYSLEDKTAIARRYLIPRQVTEAGLKPDGLKITDEGLEAIISKYTREAGVRELERTVARIARKVARRVAEGDNESFVVDPEFLREHLGPERFLPEKARRALVPGVAAGLAWTEAGGEILYVEATLLPEGEGLEITGSVGEVMRESAKAAQSYVWAHAEDLGIDIKLLRKSRVHVHIPAGAVPKDGPSAGVALVTALASAYTKTAAASDIAMTGEIALTGLVLPVGGIREKVLAARRAGMHRVLLPRDNEKDLTDIPKHVRDTIEFILVDNVDDVLAAAMPGAAQHLKMTQGSRRAAKTA